MLLDGLGWTAAREAERASAIILATGVARRAAPPRHRTGRLVGAPHPPAAGRAGARDRPDGRHPPVHGLAAGTGRHGRRGTGVALAAGGLATATVGGYLGGYLAMRLGAGSSHAESVGHLAAIGWQDLCPLAELPPGRPVRRQLGYIKPARGARRGRRLRALRPVLPPGRAAATRAA